VESDRAKILWGFHIQNDKQVIANYLDLVVVNKLQKKAVAIDVAFLSDSNMKKKEHEKLEKYQGMKEDIYICIYIYIYITKRSR